MRVWSKGLRRIALNFDLGDAIINVESGQNIPAENVEAEAVVSCPVVSGKTKDPVIWEFKIWFEYVDVPSLIKIALSRPLIRLVSIKFLTK